MQQTRDFEIIRKRLKKRNRVSELIKVEGERAKPDSRTTWSKSYKTIIDVNLLTLL